MRSGLRSPCAAPVRLSTSSSISRCAAKPTISRSKSASELFSSKVRRRIISSVIVGSLVRVKVWRPNPTGDPRCPPPWISGPLPPDSRRSRQRATYPQLLHHLKGPDLGSIHEGPPVAGCPLARAEQRNPFAPAPLQDLHHCRVGGGALDCSRAGLRPPLKLGVQFSRTQLSRRRSSLSGNGRDQRD